MQSLQRIAVQLHRWTGLILALFVLVLGATGAVLVFRPEIDRWLNADLFAVEPGGDTLRIADVLQRVAAAYPGTRPGEVLYGERPGEAWRILTQQQPGSPQGRTLEVFVNPHTGQVVGDRVHVDALVTPAPFDRRSVMMYIRRVHFEWLLGETAYRIVGVITMVWLATTLIGLYIAWPKRNQWRRALAIKLSAGALRGWFDSHRSLGLLSSLILLPVLVTGLWWNADYLVRPLVKALLPQGGSIHMMGEHHGMHAIDEPRAPPEEIVSRAAAHEPGARVSRLVFDYSMGQYLVWLHHPEGSRLLWLAHDMNGGGNAMLTYSMDSGELLHAVNAQTARAGDVYAALQYPLHTGSYFGLAGRWLWLLASLVPVLLAISGVYVWAKRRPGRKIAARARAAGAIPG